MKDSGLVLNGKEVLSSGASLRSHIEALIARGLLCCARCDQKLEPPEEYSNLVEYAGDGPFKMTLICDVCTMRVLEFIETGS